MSKPDDGKFIKNLKSPSEDESREKTAGSLSSSASSQSSPAKLNSIVPKNINVIVSPSTDKKPEHQKHVSANDEEEDEGTDKKVKKEKEAPVKPPSQTKSSPSTNASTDKTIDSTTNIKSALKSPPAAVSKQPIETDDEDSYSAEDESDDDKKSKKNTFISVHLERRKKDEGKEKEKIHDDRKPQEKPIAEPQKASERALHLYRFKTKEQAQAAEMRVQKRVNRKFFRLGKNSKENKESYKIYKKLFDVERAGRDAGHRDRVPTTFKNLTELQSKAIEYYNHDNRVVLLDNYTARSVIAGIIMYLNMHGHIPTCVFGIGSSRILCVSNKTDNQRGNFIVQAINKITSLIIFIPSVYGNGNGNIKFSVIGPLEEINKHPTLNVFQMMINKAKPISSFTELQNIDNHVRLMNQLNLLHSILEIARRSYLHEETQEPIVAIDALPIGISQSRTLRLLAEKRITIYDAFGWDREGKYYQTNDEKDEFKAPFNAVAGKGLSQERNATEAKRKVERINDAYNGRYQTHKTDSYPFVIEGARLLRARLGEHYGSGDESDGSDYSASDSDVGGEKIVYKP